MLRQPYSIHRPSRSHREAKDLSWKSDLVQGKSGYTYSSQPELHVATLLETSCRCWMARDTHARDRELAVVRGGRILVGDSAYKRCSCRCFLYKAPPFEEAQGILYTCLPDTRSASNDTSIINISILWHFVSKKTDIWGGSDKIIGL